MVKISASMWSADLINLELDMKKIEPYVDRFHFDVGDGNYIKKLLFFPDLIKKLRSKTKKEFEIHLMVKNAEDFLDLFSDIGIDIILFHLECVNDVKKFIKKIKRLGIHVGIVIMFNQNISKLEEIIEEISTITVMGTKLGVKGKEFNKSTLDKIEEIKNLIDQKNLENIEIEVDGGIRPYSAPLIAKAGGTMIVGGTILFNKDYKRTCRWLKSL